MKGKKSLLREKPEYEDYSDNIAILTREEEREFGITNISKSSGGCSGCSGCGSKKTSSTNLDNKKSGCSGCSGGCCGK